MILAYLTFESYGYFVGERECGEFLFEALEKILERGWECDIICRLALLKHDTETGQWNASRRKRAEQIVAECTRERLKFEFFQRMPRELLQACQLEDKVFVQCKAKPGARVTLYYRAERETDFGEEKTEPIKERYQGIYNKEFILFYGEKLHYHFVIEERKGTKITEEQVLTVEDMKIQGQSKYHMLNTMLQLKAQGETQELCKKTEAYLRQEQQIKELFALLD